MDHTLRRAQRLELCSNGLAPARQSQGINSSPAPR